MQTFAIYSPPVEKNLTAEASAVQTKFLSDGKSVLALIVPLVWLIWQRLWFALGIYLAYGFALMLIARLGHDTLAALLSALPGIYLLLEGRQLIVRKLELAGWQYKGVVLAADSQDAADRYFRKEGIMGLPETVSSQPGSKRPLAINPTNALGLFPE